MALLEIAVAVVVIYAGKPENTIGILTYIPALLLTVIKFVLVVTPVTGIAVLDAVIAVDSASPP